MSPTGRPSGRGGPHVFVDRLDAPELSDADRHHLERSLRMRAGDDLTLSDGAGRWCAAVLTVDGAEPVGEVFDVEAPEPPITVGFTPVKGVRPEFVVQKLTEIGVDRIVPLVADRSVVRWADDRAIRQVERLQVTAREAAMQSRQVHIPVVGRLTPVESAVADLGAALAEPAAERLTGDETVVLVGPEGGWSEAELARPARHVSLGPSVLRAETAAIVAAALLVDRRDHGRNPLT